MSVVVAAHIRLLYTDYQDVAVVYVCPRLASANICCAHAHAPGRVDVYSRAPSLADERRASLNDNLRYHGYADGVASVVARAGFKAARLTTVLHRGICLVTSRLATGMAYIGIYNP